MTNYAGLAQVHSSLSRGMVWCTSCGRSQRIDPANCLQNGWPKCCGYTMTIDSPSERRELNGVELHMQPTKTVMND